jgi:dihydroorotate dehydrogenase
MLSKKNFLESLTVLAEEERPISTKEKTYFYNLYKDLLKKLEDDDEKFNKIAKAVSSHKIDPLTFRNTMAKERLIELTPRQAQIYLYTICIVLLSNGL